MRTITYISGILGGLLIMIPFLETVTGIKDNDIFLISGLALIILVFFPFLIIDRHRQQKKIDNIIKSYSDKPFKDKPVSSGKSEIKGWSMNNSPFRERKSGLSWGGGNIKGANATRGKRKSFLK